VAASETGLTEREVRTCFSTLQGLSNIGVKTTNRYSIVTICNWDLYQCAENENDQQTTSKRPANDHYTRTKELKEVVLNKEIESKITEFWASLVAEFGFAAIKKLTPRRRRHIAARIADGSVSDVGAIAEEIRKSAFLRGENPRGWRMDFDWLFGGEANILKILEGKYRDGKFAGRNREGAGYLAESRNQLSGL
jgi:hypothetical protein